MLLPIYSSQNLMHSIVHLLCYQNNSYISNNTGTFFFSLDRNTNTAAGLKTNDSSDNKTT